jgi:hypothetical protein
VALNHLVGQEFQVGAVRLRGAALRALRLPRRSDTTRPPGWIDPSRRIEGRDRDRRNHSSGRRNH